MGYSSSLSMSTHTTVCQRKSRETLHLDVDRQHFYSQAWRSQQLMERDTISPRKIYTSWSQMKIAFVYLGDISREHL